MIGADTTFLYSDPDLQQKILDYTHGDGVDLVILTANPFPAHKTACELVRDNGRVSIVALTGTLAPAADHSDKDLYCFSGSCTTCTDSCSARQIVRI